MCLDLQIYDWGWIWNSGPFFHALNSPQYLSLLHDYNIGAQQNILAQDMVLYNIEYRAFVLLICVGLLAIRPHQVCGSRKVVLGARNHHRMIKAIDHHMNSLSTDKKRASVASKKYDANQSSKRTVRRGSDPIHNRTWSRAMCIARPWKQRHTEETLHQCIKIRRSWLWKFGWFWIIHYFLVS